ncbi:MAG: hypothetical protein VKP72_11310 [bacterium]|nr:hypothetical protein [bacterium]
MTTVGSTSNPTITTRPSNTATVVDAPAAGAAGAPTGSTPATNAPADRSAVGGGDNSGLALNQTFQSGATVSTPRVTSSPIIEPPPPPPPPMAQGLTFKSWGDPHEVSGDGLKFDNMGLGVFTALQSASGDLRFDKKHESIPGTGADGSTVNTEAAIQFGTDLISYKTANNELMINGKKVELKDKEVFQLPDGGSVTRNGENYTAVSAKGDSITIQDRGKYLDFEGAISANRADGEVTGSLGRFDADTSATNDLVKADGTQAKDVNDFINSWKPAEGQSLLDKKPEDLSKFAEEKKALQSQLDGLLKQEDALGKERLPILKEVSEMEGTVELLRGLKPLERTEADDAMIAKFDGLKSKLETLNGKIEALNQQQEPIRKRIEAIGEIQGIEQQNKQLFTKEADAGQDRRGLLQTALKEAGVKTVDELKAKGERLAAEPVAILSEKDIDLRTKIPAWLAQITAFTDLIGKLNSEQSSNDDRIRELDQNSRIPAPTTRRVA